MNKQSDDKASVGFFSYTCMDSFHPVLEIRMPDLTGRAKSFHHDAFLKQNNSNNNARLQLLKYKMKRITLIRKM